MLRPITKKFSDKSTLKLFEFVFYCDCCKKAIPTTIYEYNNMFIHKTFLSDDEREARAIIYASEHNKAYERANNEVRLELNKCAICGNMVCEDCSFYSNDLNGKIICKNCNEKK